MMVFILLLSGCEGELPVFISNTPQTTIESTMVVTETEETTTNIISTTDTRTDINDLPTTTARPTTAVPIEVLDGFFEQLQPLLPDEMTEDIVLPTIELDGLTIEYYYQETLIEDRVLEYEKQPYHKDLDIWVMIIYHHSSQAYHFTVTQLRDETLYYDELFDQTFDALIEQIPQVIFSHLTLPDHMNDMTIDYTVEGSEIIYQRLQYLFPAEEEIVRLTIQLSYDEQTRRLTLPITMAAYIDLPMIPQIHITTDQQAPIDFKETYVDAYLDLFEYDHQNQPIQLLNQAPMQIRLRGNSTMFMPKKPYKIKFLEKQQMLSMHQEKDWVLLANFADHTLLRNALAFQMASDLNMAFAPMVEFVDVYVNGIYQGNYLLTDQVEVTNDRVNIEENTTNIDTGYLIEFDKRLYDIGFDLTDENFFLIDGIPFVIKSPNIEDTHYSNDQYLFIESYMREVFDALKNQEDYHQWIDEASFIDWFIVNEVFKNVDSGYSSVFYYKDSGGLLKMGPVWDFDLSSGNYGHLQEDMRGPEGWYTSRSDKNILFHYLMTYDSFRQALKLRWNAVYEHVILKMIDQIYPMADAMTRSRYDNFNTWDIIGSYDDWYISPEILALDTYNDHIEFLRNFLIERVAWLHEEINAF